MASIQEPGIVRLYREKPSGARTPILSAGVTVTAPAGGAPDGAGASVSTPEKWIKVHQPGVQLMIDDFLTMTFEAVGADGIDVSDSIWSIPFVTPAGTQYLSQSDFAAVAAADYTTTAAREIVVAKKRVTEGNGCYISGPLYLDMQDDTA